MQVLLGLFKDLSAEFAVLSIALMLLLLSCLVKSNKQIVFMEWLVAIAMSVIGFCLLCNAGSPDTGSKLYILDGLSVVARCMILVMVSCMYLLPHWTRHGSTNCRLSYSFVLLVAALGMMLAVLAKNLFVIYLALELFSIAFYILISIDKTNWFAVDAGVRYFVSSSFFSGIYLYGTSLVYAYSGTTVIPAMFQYMPNPSSMLMLGYVMIAAGLLFKIGCAPFHVWLPDVYQGAPMLATILLSTASKFTIVVVFFRCLPFFLTAPLIFSLLFKAVGVASMIVGAFASLRQSNIKRLLAFGSMLHTGYIIVMLAFCVDRSVGLAYLLKAVLVYMFFYIVFSIGMFALVALCGKDNNRCSRYTIDRLSVIHNKSNVFIGFCAAVLICSGVAVPPLAGFFAKFYILGAIIKHSTVITVIAMVSIIASSYYYIKMLAAIYFSSKDGDVAAYEELDQGVLLRVLLILTAMVSLFFVLYSGAIDQMFSGLIAG